MQDGLRSAGAIVLVSCYELGHPPLGIAWPAAFLERAGFKPKLVDLATDPLDVEAHAGARLFLLSTPMHTALSLGVRAAAEIRARLPGAKIGFLGWYATLNAQALVPSICDFVLAGELEEELIEIVEAFDRGLPIDRAGGLTGLKRKLAFIAPSRSQLPPLERYAKLVLHGEERLAGAVETTRGCKHLCRHCPIPPIYEGRFFAVPEGVVMEDVDALVRHGARHITFADADFLNAPTHAKRIARALHHAHPDVTFDFTAKIEHLVTHAEPLADLARHGAVFVVSAVESLSDRVLFVLDKGHTRADVERALAITEAARIALRPSLLPFTPWSTLEDYLELLELIAARDLVEHVDPVQLSVRLLVPPGSLLESHAEMKPHLGALLPHAFSWTWTHPDPRMDVLAQSVARIVAEAADRGRPASQTFALLYAEATSIAGVRATSIAFDRPKSKEVPRLTEPWFC
jgi:radical SAM superfamily enzyme YgiQ (UPF0313 family)